MDRFFYHSFPRPRRDEDAIAKGFKILRSILTDGLLLVPETISFSDPYGRKPDDKITAVQRRICFTELQPNELPDHAKSFGPFAIEFTIPSLRLLGALPTIYVPDSARGLEAIGTSLLARFSDAVSILDSLMKTKSFSGPNLKVTLTTSDGTAHAVNFDEHQTTAIRQYISMLEGIPGKPIIEIVNALIGMSGIFYPTDNLRYTGELGYYRQREWRIVSGGFVDDVATTTPASPPQIRQLLEIDSDFFSKEMEFATGRATRAERCHFMNRVGEKHITSFISRIVVPASGRDTASELLADTGLVVPVVDLEELGR
jgi:hypothetical protein